MIHGVNQGAVLRMTLGAVAVFAVLAVWVVLSIDSRSCDQIIREVAQNRIPDRCWR
jgi:hypothetical protein